MEKWEYCILRGRDTENEFAERLNELGKAGWEAVTGTFNWGLAAEELGAQVLLKRRLTRWEEMKKEAGL